ncbi:MAG TPA: NAD(P)-dependent oxidoreductase [Planctomycetota bacterium]|nr:NAD(P)-dependent oxidoreductase [Planctomycetota bacterium]
MARVLIAGAEGGLGQAWVRKLSAPGLSLGPAFPGPVEVIPRSHSSLDVSALQEVPRVLEETAPDVVLNCSGRTDLEFCQASPWEAFRVNRDGADHIAKACAKRGVLPVYFSTDLVFDGGKLEPYREEDPPNPLNAYGESKLAGELATASGSKRYLIVRSGCIYGHPGRDFLRPLFGPAPFVVNDTQIGQATWVEDFMEGVLFLLRGGKTGRWHVASRGAVTQAQVVDRARELNGGGGPPAEGRGPMARPRVPGSSVLDITKLVEAGHPMRGWETGLEAYFKTMT